MLKVHKRRDYVGYYFKMNQDIDPDKTIFFVKNRVDENKYLITWHVGDEERSTKYPVEQVHEYLENKNWILI